MNVPIQVHMESVNTVPETSGGIQSDAGNSHEEIIRSPEQWAEQTSAVQNSDRRGRKPLPPPFLLKIYDIVDDPNTNSIISWGPNKTSFIIFDQLNFTSQILPNHFRHGNFSSFIYQLNNYGFRKISWNKIEYENRWFQAGKKHWLKYIKRRNQIPHPETYVVESSPSSNLDSKMEIVQEIEILKGEENKMNEEIEKLRKKQDELADKFNAFKENIVLADSKYEEIMTQLVVMKLLENVRRKRGIINTESSKRQKLTTHQFQNEWNEIQPEAQILSIPGGDDSGSSNQDEETDTFPGNAENCAYWQKILEDDFEYEYQEPEFEENNHIKLETRQCASHGDIDITML